MSEPHLACVRCGWLNDTDPCCRCWNKNTHELLPGDVETYKALIAESRKAREALEEFWRQIKTNNPKH